jgi:hypothetical protein
LWLLTSFLRSKERRHTLQIGVSIGVLGRRVPGPIVLLSVLDGRVLMTVRQQVGRVCRYCCYTIAIAILTKGEPWGRAGQKSPRMVRTLLIFQKSFAHGFPAAPYPKHRCRHTDWLLRLRLSSCLLCVAPHPLGRLDRHIIGRRLASALP